MQSETKNRATNIKRRINLVKNNPIDALIELEQIYERQIQKWPSIEQQKADYKPGIMNIIEIEQDIKKTGQLIQYLKARIINPVAPMPAIVNFITNEWGF